MRYHKIPRLLVNQNLSLSQIITLEKEQSHYLLNVMRKKLSDEVLVFNGNSDEFLAKIIDDNKKACSLEILKKVREFAGSPNLTLVFSPVKSVKPEFIIQKATELGVRKIIPCVFKNTVKEGANLERLNAVAIEASEQCERLDIPEISEVIGFEKALKYCQENPQNKSIILCDETGKGKTALEVLTEIKNKNSNNPEAENIIFVGAEGGFDNYEIEKLYALKNCYGIGLGTRILKAETALLSAISIWQMVCGDFDKQPDFRG